MLLRTACTQLTVFSGEFSGTEQTPPGTTGATLALERYSSMFAVVTRPPASVTATYKQKGQDKLIRTQTKARRMAAFKPLRSSAARPFTWK